MTETQTPARPLTLAPADQFEHVGVTQVGGSIGAMVSGITVGGGVPAPAIAELLGPVTKPHPTVSGDGKSVLPIDSEQGKANSWHTDVTFVDRVPATSVLRAITLPGYGGSTVWANTVHAYRRLHPALQALAGELRAVHSNLYDYAAQWPQLGGVDVKEQQYREEFRHLEFETEHPVVRIHPETGEPSLLLGHFVRHFTGLSSVVRKGDASAYSAIAA
jgi:alpha-ketoglutarate-dependent sulfate ester dioxygenase